MAKGKSPNIDGLASKVFCSCWHFIEGAFFDLVLHFWDTHELYLAFNLGVLKLVSKKADWRQIKVWRSLAMLSTTYKSLAKLITLCLQNSIPQLVFAKQSKFILGRQILDNILLTWLAIKGEINKLSALFLHLNFEKAFD